jgi:small-conductance mechanosensitive channel
MADERASRIDTLPLLWNLPVAFGLLFFFNHLINSYWTTYQHRSTELGNQLMLWFVYNPLLLVLLVGAPVLIALLGRREPLPRRVQLPLAWALMVSAVAIFFMLEWQRSSGAVAGASLGEFLHRYVTLLLTNPVTGQAHTLRSLIVGVWTLMMLVFYVGCILWVWGDADRRGKPGFLVALLVASMPWLGLLLWIIARPAAITRETAVRAQS